MRRLVTAERQVRLRGEDLRGHVIGRVVRVVRGWPVAAEPKVRELDRQFLPRSARIQRVFQLDVAVVEACRVDVLERGGHLPQNIGRLRAGRGLGAIDELDQATAGHVFECQHNGGLARSAGLERHAALVRRADVHDVRVRQAGQVVLRLTRGRGARGQDLNGHLFARCPHRARIHRPVKPVSKGLVVQDVDIQGRRTVATQAGPFGLGCCQGGQRRGGDLHDVGQTVICAVICGPPAGDG